MSATSSPTSAICRRRPCCSCWNARSQAACRNVRCSRRSAPASRQAASPCGMPREPGIHHPGAGDATAARRARACACQHQESQGARRNRGRRLSLSVCCRCSRGLADYAVDLWLPSARESPCPRRLRRVAGPSCLDHRDPGIALDHADHRPSGQTVDRLRPLSLSRPSELCGRGRGDRDFAAGAASADHGADIHAAERRRTLHSYPCGGARAQRGRDVASNVMNEQLRLDAPISGSPALRIWAGFLLMCLGMFMAILDIQVVATSLPTIQDALGISRDAMSWVQTAYLIAEVVAIALTVLFTRTLSLRWLFVTAVSLFTLASIGCAFSTDFATLLVFRVVQGFSGGVLIPAVFSAVFMLFPPRLHAVATTIGGVVAVLAPTVGPVVGGFITATWSWPWLFLINVVPGLIAASTTSYLLPQQRTDFGE